MHFRRRLSPNANVDLIPMIDVVFQLVVFFMVSSTFVMTPGIALDLPESTSSEPVVIDRVVVTIVNESRLYLNRDEVSYEELDARLEALEEQSERLDAEARSAIVEANADVSYATIVSVLDVMRRNGYRGIALRTLEEQQERQ
ncbi:MAG: ExbD/TolR family protein [Spirochaetota bacterium]